MNIVKKKGFLNYLIHLMLVVFIRRVVIKIIQYQAFLVGFKLNKINRVMYKK